MGRWGGGGLGFNLNIRSVHFRMIDDVRHFLCNNVHFNTMSYSQIEMYSSCFEKLMKYSFPLIF